MCLRLLVGSSSVAPPLTGSFFGIEDLRLRFLVPPHRGKLRFPLMVVERWFSCIQHTNNLICMSYRDQVIRITHTDHLIHMLFLNYLSIILFLFCNKKNIIFFLVCKYLLFML